MRQPSPLATLPWEKTRKSIRPAPQQEFSVKILPEPWAQGRPRRKRFRKRLRSHAVSSRAGAGLSRRTAALRGLPSGQERPRKARKTAVSRRSCKTNAAFCHGSFRYGLVSVSQTRPENPQCNTRSQEAAAEGEAPWARNRRTAKPCGEDRAAARADHWANSREAPPNGSPLDRGADQEEAAQRPGWTTNSKKQPRPRCHKKRLAA